MNRSIPRQRALGIKRIHHQTGALSSHNDATRLEIHPKLRRLPTNGTRCSSAGVSGTTTWVGLIDVVPAAISAPPSRRFLRLVRRPRLLRGTDRHASDRTPAMSTVLRHN